MESKNPLIRIWAFAKGAKDIVQYALWLSSFIGGGGLMIYFASITKWAIWLGPLGWALIAIAAMLLVMIGYYIWTVANSRRALNEYVRAKIDARGVNTLAPEHDHERINLSDFYHPLFFPTEHVRFTDCELLGPASIAIIDSCVFDGCGFIDCEFVIVRSDRPVRGVSAFRACTFLRGRLIRITLLMNIQQYQNLPAIMRQQIPVISDGRIGNI